MSKRKQASNISGGIFLIGLGVLFITDWFWPGILLVIGLSSGAELIFRGRVREGIGTMAMFAAIPIAITIAQSLDVSWAIIGPFVLIAIGAVILVKTLFLKGGGEEEKKE